MYAEIPNGVNQLTKIYQALNKVIWSNNETYANWIIQKKSYRMNEMGLYKKLDE